MSKEEVQRRFDQLPPEQKIKETSEAHDEADLWNNDFDILRGLKEKPTEEQWLTYRKEIEELHDDVMGKAEELYGTKGSVTADRKIREYAASMPTKPVDRYRYVGWHKVVGSGTSYKTSPLLDLPGAYSVKSFLLKLRDELDDSENFKKLMKRYYG